MNFKREAGKDCLEEMKPLFQKHWKEIAHYHDIPLNPDYELYLKMDASGLLRCYTAREDDGTLVGYAVYFLKHNIHYKTSLQALQDVIFIDPKNRGIGGKLVIFCDRELRKEGVQVVFQHVKVSTPQTIEFFKRCGYKSIDLIMGKRLDKEG